MENSTGPAPRKRFLALIPALLIAAALLAVVALLGMSVRRGQDFKKACEAVRPGATWQEASKGLVENGGVVTGWGGPTGGPILKRDWGREAFPLRRQSCDLTLDENGRVMQITYKWWFIYGPSSYHRARIKQVLGL